MSDRITGVLVMILALGFFLSARNLEAPFFADPLGPKAFPMLIAAVGFVAGCIIFLKPDAEPDWPALHTILRLGLAVVILLAYAFSLKPLGFLLPTVLGAGLLSYMLKPSPALAAMTGIGLSLGLFVLFRYALGLSLFAFPRWLSG